MDTFDTWFDETFSDSSEGAAEPAASATKADAQGSGTQTPPASEGTFDSGNATGAEASPESSEQTLDPEQLKAQLAQVQSERDALKQRDDAEEAAKQAAQAAQKQRERQELVRRELSSAKKVYNTLRETDPDAAKEFDQVFTGMTGRIQQAEHMVSAQDNAISAFVYVASKLAPDQFSDLIEMADEVASLTGQDMIAAVDSILDRRLNARETSLKDQSRIAQLEAEIAELKAQSTNPAAHLVDGGGSQPAFKSLADMDIDETIAYAMGR